jgi:hypothetical protein
MYGDIAGKWGDGWDALMELAHKHGIIKPMQNPTERQAFEQRMWEEGIEAAYGKHFINILKSVVYDFEQENINLKKQPTSRQPLTWQRDWLMDKAVQAQVSARPLAYAILDYTYKAAPVLPTPAQLKTMAHLAKRERHKVRKNRWQYAIVLTNSEFYKALNAEIQTINKGKGYTREHYKKILDAFCKCEVFFKLHAWRGGTVLAVGYYTKGPYTNRLYKTPVAKKAKCYKKLLNFKDFF